MRDKQLINLEERNITLFFEAVKIAIGRKKSFSIVPSADDWNYIYDMAKRQTLIGVLFSCVERLPPEQYPQQDLLLNWYALVSKIEERNKLMNDQCVKVQQKFQLDGRKSCILKGQGIAQYYPNPLRRQCGDIDIWVEGGKKDIIKKYYSKCRRTLVRFHHMEYPMFKDTEVELHFFPSWMNRPFLDRKLQRYFREEEKEQFSNYIEICGKSVCVPTRKFNVFYIFLHIYRHLFEEGIGMRQLMDYYFVLMSDGQSQNDEKLLQMLKDFDLYKFASSVMWVLGEIFGLEKEKMIVEPNENHGRFLLREIMISGNFGKYDSRFKHKYGEATWLKFLRKQRYRLRLIWNYPIETLWSPVFSIYQWCWRLINGFIKKKV